ncbi:MAG TPA: response regulator [Candidatus Omnitrophota bacterium]|nr:response regulator [Candidatus Omnitrophota bacterium]
MTKFPRLLVVDDELDICNFVKSFFELRGFSVSTALNSDEALERLGERPDVVILDVMMRRGSEGMEFLPKIKELLPTARVIMVTGVEDNANMDAARELGADDYITKPLVLEYLENTVLGKIRELSKAGI